MAISRALMTRVAAGELPDTLRISRPAASVAFGKRDVVGAGYSAAVAAAHAGGYEAVERVAGGRASVFHDQTIHVGHSVHHADPRVEVTRRFERTAELLTGALRGLGVDAHVGEVEGEYCPGRHSVNARHEAKLAGLGQRVIQRGAHVGAVVVVDGADRIRTVLEPVYDALELDWRPETTGSLADEDPAITWERARKAIGAEYSSAYDLEPAELDDDTLALAERLAPEHVSSAGG
jgi:octanoyl-[GcvH]:protein N-octanoyltransferase